MDSLSDDANGNMINDGANTYTWDARNQLAAISGGSTADFQYDPFGRRTSKTVGGATVDFLYDGVNAAQEQPGGGQTTDLLTGLGVDEYFVRTDQLWSQHFLPDGLGSTIALTDGTGTVAKEYTYEPFGETTQVGADTTNSFQYTDRENDGRGCSTTLLDTTAHNSIASQAKARFPTQASHASHSCCRN